MQVPLIGVVGIVGDNQSTHSMNVTRLLHQWIVAISGKDLVQVGPCRKAKTAQARKGVGLKGSGAVAGTEVLDGVGACPGNELYD